jgi:DnaJ-class molecular chaperone
MTQATGALATECPTCHGMGQTRNTCTEMEVDKDGHLHTVLQGSGCPRCFGTGQLGADL